MNELETLKAKLQRVEAMEAQAAGIRATMTEAESRLALERAEATVNGTPAPKRDKQADGDKQRLADIESSLPHALQLVSSAAISYRNTLAQKIDAAQKAEGKAIDVIRTEIQGRMRDAMEELRVLETTRDARLIRLIDRAQTFLQADGSGDICAIAAELESEYADILSIEAPK